MRFLSSMPEIASVNAKTGEVKGLRPGHAVVTAAAYNGAMAECVVTVKGAPAGVGFQEKSVTVAVGSMTVSRYHPDCCRKDSRSAVPKSGTWSW